MDLSAVLYRLHRQRKELVCVFDEIETPIEIKAGAAIKGRITIAYRGRPVTNLFVIRVRLRNTGTTPIRPADILTPVTFTFPKGVDLLKRPNILQPEPKNIKVHWILKASVPETTRNVAKLSWNLLNPREELIFEFVGTGPGANPKVFARIVGPSKIKVTSEAKLYRKRDVLYIFLPWAALILALLGMRDWDPSIPISLLMLIFLFWCINWLIHHGRGELTRLFSGLRRRDG
jgi:hypothetical protein